MDKDRWIQLSLAQQLGNIGSEISRARHWEEKYDILNRNKSLARIIVYLDFMLDEMQPSPRYKELARFREVIGDWFSDQHSYGISPQQLEDYCIPFAVKARSNR
jgi:hypothetical protein